jgi:hypothetical protein
MLRFRRFASTFAAALLVSGAAAMASAQVLARGNPGNRPSAPPAGQVPLPACGPTTLTESGTQTVTADNSAACTTGGFNNETHLWRAFVLTDLGITTDFSVCSVTIGVQEAVSGSGSQPITVNLYVSNQAFPTGYPDSLTLIGTTSTTVADQTLSLVNFPVAGTAPKASQLVVEIFVPNGSDGSNRFIIGSNADPETAPSYFSAPDCGAPDPVPTADIGHPDMHIVMTVAGAAVGPVALHVDSPVGLANGNGVLEMGEDAVIAPDWANGGLVDISLTGVASNLTGPVLIDTQYTIEPPGTADYGTITAGHDAACVTCYTISITGTRPSQHFDATMDETVTPSPFTLGSGGQNILKTWTLHVGGSFSDVDPDIVADPYYPSIETIFHFGVTAGCGDGTTFCPQQNNLRQEMAVFLLKAFLGSTYTPPACTPPGVFTDVACPGLYTDFIEDLKTRGVTAGCGDGTTYCPTDNVLRQEMAVFLLRTLLGGDYVPPACTPPGQFGDTPCPGQYTDFIEDLKTRGITAGCHGGVDFCPTDPVTRQEMAAFLTRTFSLVLYGP